jgi:hypothetical protein
MSSTSSLSSKGGSSATGNAFSSDGNNAASDCLISVGAASCRHVLKAEPAKP